MEEFTNLENIDLNVLADSVLKSFGERYAMDVTRILNGGFIYPQDLDMIRLSLAITMGMYVKKVVENEFEDEVMH